MSDCSRHTKDAAGITDMKLLAEMIGDLHYESLMKFLYSLYRKIDEDGQKDFNGGREKLADALQYLGMSLYESSLRAEKVWKISKPFMQNNELNQEVSDTTKAL